MEMVHDLMERMAGCIEAQFDKGIENVNTDEMSKVVDMLKDIAMTEYYLRHAHSDEMEK